jgi:hypothetical protein
MAFKIECCPVFNDRGWCCDCGGNSNNGGIFNNNIMTRKEYFANYRAANPDRFRAAKDRWKQKHVYGMSDSYIIQLLKLSYGYAADEITPELITNHRNQLIKRRNKA